MLIVRAVGVAVVIRGDIGGVEAVLGCSSHELCGSVSESESELSMVSAASAA